VGCTLCVTLVIPYFWVLTTLDCSGCLNIKELPERLPTSLTTLDCSDCHSLEKLPKFLPTSLTTFNCTWCMRLMELPTDPCRYEADRAYYKDKWNTTTCDLPLTAKPRFEVPPSVMMLARAGVGDARDLPQVHAKP